MKSKLAFISVLVLLGLTSIVPVVSAADPMFIPLVGIPGVDPNDPVLGTYINAVYRLSISLAALLAVIKIVAAGASYMLSDIVTNKSKAKDDIRGALIGLLIVISAVLILTTVNSDLTKTDLLVTPVDLRPVREPERTPQQILCDASGGCTLLSCDAVGQSLATYVVDGAIAGGLIGVTGTLILGPGGTVTAGGGAIIGSVIGGVFYFAEDYVSCNTVCAWRYGTMTDGNTCSVPADREAYMAAEAASILAAAEAARTALVAECSGNLNNNTCCAASAGIYNGTTCSLGEIMPIPGGYPGDPPSVAELNCITGPGYQWDELNRVCRARPLYQYEPFPTDGDRTYLLECQIAYGNGWTYNPPPADNCQYIN